MAPLPIPAPANPEPPERRALINAARERITAGEVIEPVPVRYPPRPPEQEQFGHRADCTAWVLDAYPDDDGFTEQVARIQGRVGNRAAFSRSLNLGIVEQ